MFPRSLQEVTDCFNFTAVLFGGGSPGTGASGLKPNAPPWATAPTGDVIEEAHALHVRWLLGLGRKTINEEQ
jgi:hypothetical protein